MKRREFLTVTTATAAAPLAAGPEPGDPVGPERPREMKRGEIDRDGNERAADREDLARVPLEPCDVALLRGHAVTGRRCGNHVAISAGTPTRPSATRWTQRYASAHASASGAAMPAAANATVIAASCTPS